MYASVNLNIGNILLLPAPLAAFQQPHTRLSFLFTSLIIPLLRLLFLRYCVRLRRLLPTLCSQFLGLSSVIGGVK
jgi:hypothetical protein